MGIDELVPTKAKSTYLKAGRSMLFRTMINATEVVIDLPGVSDTAFTAVGELIDQALARPKMKNRDAIKDAYLTALRTCPTANASDLWHHVVYRQYCHLFNRHRPQDAKQSWVRASGEALELAVEELYSVVLLEHGIRIQVLISKPRKLAALKAMSIDGVVGSDKLDVVLFLDDTDTIFGGIHVKASLAERISDDVPCSRAMMNNGYFSPLWTLIEPKSSAWLQATHDFRQNRRQILNVVTRVFLLPNPIVPSLPPIGWGSNDDIKAIVGELFDRIQAINGMHFVQFIGSDKLGSRRFGFRINGIGLALCNVLE